MSEIVKNVESAHISQVRQMMLEQLRALRTAPIGEALAEELKRAKGVSELSQTIINSAKVEIEYLELTGQQKAGFLEEPPDATVAHLGNTPSLPANGISSITRHRLAG